MIQHTRPVPLFLALIALLLAAPAALAAPLQQESRPGQPIIIRWSTETEVDTAGYNIYRAKSEDGEWRKINERLIPGSPDPLRGGSYVFTDTQVIAGQTYWYELEEIELTGRTTRLERIQATSAAPSAFPLNLPCAGSGFLLFSLFGIVLAGRRRGATEDK